MWPFSRTAPEAEMYPFPKNNILNTENKEQDLSQEEQEIYQGLITRLKTKNLPDDQQEISPEDKEKIDMGGHAITYQTDGISLGIPSIHLAYAFHEIDQAFPEKPWQWKRDLAGKLASLLKTKHRQN
ncbi:MAG: hypothetical protein WC441_03210 [Patescibacteria group bacterium]